MLNECIRGAKSKRLERRKTMFSESRRNTDSINENTRHFKEQRRKVEVHSEFRDGHYWEVLVKRQV